MLELKMTRILHVAIDNTSPGPQYERKSAILRAIHASIVSRNAVVGIVWAAAMVLVLGEGMLRMRIVLISRDATLDGVVGTWQYGHFR
jgi:hypothetical protein